MLCMSNAPTLSEVAAHLAEHGTTRIALGTLHLDGTPVLFSDTGRLVLCAVRDADWNVRMPAKNAVGDAAQIAREIVLRHITWPARDALAKCGVGGEISKVA